MSLALAVVVSICGPLASDHPKADTSLGYILYGIDEVLEVSPEPVKLPNNQHIVYT